uniref:Uncharacterized protein n=1 Tax=Sphaerodactylus townsendi TaxID=933632 RepID=A0ACB8GCH1_9SAUR
MPAAVSGVGSAAGVAPVSEEQGPGGDCALPSYEEATGGGVENGHCRPPELPAAASEEGAGESLLTAAAAAAAAVKPADGKQEEAKKPPQSPEEPAESSPPEGGWGWLVMVASMWCNGAVFGIQNSCGVLFKSMLAEFGDPDDKQLIFRTVLLGGSK